MKKHKELNPIFETTQDYEALEAHIRSVFREEIYLPLIKELKLKVFTLKNANDIPSNSVIDAIASGRITFYRGSFKGRFNSRISKELRGLGAKWDRKQGSWKLPQSSLPMSVRQAISASEETFKQKLGIINKRLAQILPEEIADKVQSLKLFDANLWKVDKDIHRTIKGITVAPKLTPERAKKISEEYTNNLRRYIKDFTSRETKSLRKDLQTKVFSGVRYEQVAKTIQKSYGVSADKAKFLARQETSLLMTTFKEARYSEAGVKEYKWVCVTGSPKHPVRPMHKALEGKIFAWDDPPITNANGGKNNPGQDYNCRCYARPIVTINEQKDH